MTRKREIPRDKGLLAIEEFLRDLYKHGKMANRDEIRKFLHDLFSWNWGEKGPDGEVIPAKVKYPPRTTTYDWLEILLKRNRIFRAPAPSNGRLGRTKTLWGWLDA